MPSLSAATRIGVPCSSVPLTMRTLLPAIRWYRLKTSDGTPKPATWPMWRGPLAYGQAPAVRMWRGDETMAVILGRAADRPRRLFTRWRRLLRRDDRVEDDALADA